MGFGRSAMVQHVLTWRMGGGERAVLSDIFSIFCVPPRTVSLCSNYQVPVIADTFSTKFFAIPGFIQQCGLRQPKAQNTNKTPSNKMKDDRRRRRCSFIRRRFARLGCRMRTNSYKGGLNDGRTDELRESGE